MSQCSEGHEPIEYWTTSDCPLCKEQTNLLLSEAKIEEMTGTIDGLLARLREREGYGGH